MSLAKGQILQGRYRIVSLISQGGMGTVYKAWDLNLQSVCAVKENLDLSAASQLQFTNEAFMLAQLSHPGLPRVTDHFIILNLGQYLVMEFVEGQDLEDVLSHRGRQPEVQVLPIIHQICDALTYLHSQRQPIIHRDVKPANIKITPQRRAVLVDFGIAKVYSGQGETVQGARGYTPGYSPPEQYGYGRTDARSDVYALGATLYALLTGQLPPESVHRLAGTTLPSPRGPSPDVITAILKAMALEPDARYQSVEAFYQALVSPAKRTVAWLLPLAGIVTALIFALFIWWTVSSSSDSRTIPVTAVIFATVTESSAGPIPTITNDAGGSGSLATRPSEPPQTPRSTLEPTLQPTQVSTLMPTQEPTSRPTEVPTPTDVPAAKISYPLQSTIGRSFDSARIDAYQFGDGGKTIILVGGLHAGAAPSTVDLANMAIANYTSYPSDVPDNVTLYVIPNANPDSDWNPGGKSGRLNGNDVDPNRNFGCNWSTNAEWKNQPIGSGSGAFSEPESRVIRDFVYDTNPLAVIFYEAMARDGMVAPGNCNGQKGGSDTLAEIYRKKSGYPLYTGYSLTGDSSDWLGSQNIASVAVLLRSHDSLGSSEWERNLRAIQEVLDRYASQ